MYLDSNSLFVADPIDVLLRLDPSQFDLVILDPPFFGGYLVDLNNIQKPPYSSYEEYIKYLVSVFWYSHRVLKPDGAILIRTSPFDPLNTRLFLDRIFGKQNYRAEIIWKNEPFGRGYKKPNSNFESVLFYSKSDKYVYNEPVKGRSENDIRLEYRHKDDKGRYKLWNLTDRIDRPNRFFTWNDILPPKGHSWKYTKTGLDALLKNGEIEFNGKYPRRKVYVSADQSISPMGFVWDDVTDIVEETDQIDQRLLKAIEMTSLVGGFVFDAFVSPISLKTIISANRKWAGVSKFDILPKESKSNYIYPINHLYNNSLQELSIVANIELPQYICRLADAEVRATNPQNNVENNGKQYAILIGINHYKDGLGDLQYCINDVVELGEKLKYHNYQIKIIHDDMEDDDLTPRRSNIEAELTSWVQNLSPEDTLFVHFSCHGSTVENEALIITSDTRNSRLQSSALHLSDVIKIMKDGRARKLVLSLDICHGGVEMGRASVNQDFIRNVYEKAEGFVLLAASTAQQVAYESPEFKHGLYSYYLIKGISGEADYDNDGRITVEDIRNYVLDQITQSNLRKGHLQEPTYRSEGIGEITLIYPEH